MHNIYLTLYDRGMELDDLKILMNFVCDYMKSLQLCLPYYMYIKMLIEGCTR